MVAGWMLYGVLVSALLLAAGLLLEEAGKRLMLPLRGVWGAMLAGSVLFPLLAGLRPGEPQVGPYPVGAEAGMMGSFPLDPLRLTVPVESPLVVSLGAALLAGWGLASLCLLGVGVISTIRLRRAMGDWRLSRSSTPRVYLAHDAGPATLGILPGAIVLPAWAASHDRRLMLTHEAEHLRAGDPLLLLTAQLLVALLPWNLPLWWQLRRLRLAVEVDCDARVLRQKSDLNSYATLLLEVGARRSGLQPLLVAFAEPASFLERRIRIMMRDRRNRGWLASLGLASLAGALLLVACSTDAPAPGPDEEPASAGADNGPVDVYPTPEEPTPPVAVIQTPPGEPATPPPPPEEAPQTAREAPAEVAPDDPETTYESHALDRQPELRNVAQIRAMMEQLYPRPLQDAGVGGNAVLQFVVEADGVVEAGSISVVESTNPQLASASAEVAEHFRFRPGMYDGRAVRTMVKMPITWQPAR